MSNLRGITNEEIVAICCADIHLSHKPPIWRSAEPNWYEAMVRPWNEILQLANQFQCSVLCVGDIFDRWNSPPELINFAIRTLPDKMICIAGQHDLPNHNYDNLSQSAYATLIEASKIQNILPGSRLALDHIMIHSFPFGTKLTPNPLKMHKLLHIALVHNYLWIKGHSYPTAPQEKMLQCKSFKNSKWMGYDAVIYGDNHKGFLTHMGETPVFNCGTLMRRKVDEKDYNPQIGLLTKTGNIIPHHLDVSNDLVIPTEDLPDMQNTIDFVMFFKELQKLGDSAFDFSEAVKRFMRIGNTPKRVQEILNKAMVEKE